MVLVLEEPPVNDDRRPIFRSAVKFMTDSSSGVRPTPESRCGIGYSLLQRAVIKPRQARVFLA